MLGKSRRIILSTLLEACCTNLNNSLQLAQSICQASHDSHRANWLQQHTLATHLNNPLGKRGGGSYFLLVPCFPQHKWFHGMQMRSSDIPL